jgi:riboflavin kinase/FMN adenylyltransferase
MQHYHSLEEVSVKNAWLTIGVFDGVHRGHREIIRKLITDAHADNSPAVVLTFDPHPTSVLTGQDIKYLTTPNERKDLLETLGVDMVITQLFTRDLSTATAQEYMSRLKQTLDLKHLVIGYDFALGKGREGNAARLTEIGRALNYTVEVIDAVTNKSGVISSTEIRKLVTAGHVPEAAELLGYHYALSGPVIHGDGRGHSIKIPTANIDYPKRKVMPANGIYVCWATVGARSPKFMAATNIGFNPTFTPERQVPSLETYLLDFDHNIYGRQVKLEFVARLRDELKFNSVEALLERIHDDINKTREMLGGK